MQVEQRRWTRGPGWGPPREQGFAGPANLVLLFGARKALSGSTLAKLAEIYPDAQILGCSTAGHIDDVHVMDDGIVATAVHFDSTRLRVGRVDLSQTQNSRDAGRRLGASLLGEDLRHVFVLSEGLLVNGSELVRGMAEVLPAEVAVTGGLSGDGARFEGTRVCVGTGAAGGIIAALGLYGQRLRVGYASVGGWDPFGPERLVTRAQGNILYELDDRSALALYKTYLGKHAAGLPASGMLFPLAIRGANGDPPVVRTVLRIDEHNQSMTFAGDIPEGGYVRLMRANFERLIEGASEAALAAGGATFAADMALLVSCVGRKQVLQQRVEEEIESVRQVLGERVALAGFYSYGEIAPFAASARCELHNQTMTITTLAES